jgi:peptidoglycan/LPS O-acetylase OafA/YrhL
MRPTSARRPALDGLRGLAALVVLVHHCMLVAPALANGYIPRPRAPRGSASWLLTYTPLHLVWAGGEAVFVFFILSGLVLALPAASGRVTSWRSYYPSRALRLYVPILVAAGAAFALVRTIARHPSRDSSWWLGFHQGTVGLRELVHDASVVQGTHARINSAFWSLQWEVIFSLLLPVFIVLFIRLRAGVLPTLAVLGLIAISTTVEHRSVLYLPIFALGVLMAQNLGRLDAAGRRFDGLSSSARWFLRAGIATLLVARWLLTPIAGYGNMTALGLELTLLGGVLVVWQFASSAGGTRLGTWPTVSWLGKRSFSLYLVHEPIVVTTAYLLHATTNPALVFVIAVPLSLLAAEVFGRLVEGPSHRLAQRVGALLKDSRSSAPAALAS